MSDEIENVFGDLSPEQQKHFDGMVKWNQYVKFQEHALWNNTTPPQLGDLVKLEPKMFVLSANALLGPFTHKLVNLFKQTVPNVTVVFAIRPKAMRNRSKEYIDIWVQADNMIQFQELQKIWMTCASHLVIADLGNKDPK